MSVTPAAMAPKATRRRSRSPTARATANEGEAVPAAPHTAPAALSRPSSHRKPTPAAVQKEASHLLASLKSLEPLTADTGETSRETLIELRKELDRLLSPPPNPNPIRQLAAYLSDYLPTPPPDVRLPLPAFARQWMRTLRAEVVLPSLLLVILLLVILPMAVRGVDGAPPLSSSSVQTTPPPPPLARAAESFMRPFRAAVTKALAIASASAPLAPALLMGLAAAIPRVAPRLLLPEPAQWAIGLALLLAASMIAGKQYGLPFSSGGGPSHTPLRLDAFKSTLLALRGGGDAALTLSQPLIAWAGSWQTAYAAHAAGGAASKLLLFGESGGDRASAAVDAIARDLMPDGAHVLELQAGADCGGSDGCAARIEKHVATASAAGQLSLVVLRQVEACATDELYDDVVAVVERFLDETPATLTTAHGEVTKALVGFVLLAPCLTTERCHTIEASGGHAANELIRSGEVEALWPRAHFSAAVNAARRAFINRLGTDLAVVCG